MTAATTKTKKFLCLCAYEEAVFKTWAAADLAALGEACAPHDKKLRATGKVLVNTSLSEPEDARVIRAGKVVTRGSMKGGIEVRELASFELQAGS